MYVNCCLLDRAASPLQFNVAILSFWPYFSELAALVSSCFATYFCCFGYWLPVLVNVWQIGWTRCVSSAFCGSCIASPTSFCWQAFVLKGLEKGLPGGLVWETVVLCILGCSGFLGCCWNKCARNQSSTFKDQKHRQECLGEGAIVSKDCKPRHRIRCVIHHVIAQHVGDGHPSADLND